MQTITPCLWCNGTAEQMADFYTTTFARGKIDAVTRYGQAAAGISGQAKGSIMTVVFEIEGQEFMALNGGPHFSFTPAISFFYRGATREEIEALWAKLSDGGTILMPLDRYPFSERFGWVQDRFGVSWQLTMAGTHQQKICPFFMCVQDQHGQAEEAAQFYIARFPNSRLLNLDRYGPGEGEPEGAVKLASFMIHGQEFLALNAGREHAFAFTPAISFIVHCQTQTEVDEFWRRLTEDGGAPSQCGWLEDRFGISWQIVPSVVQELLQSGDEEKTERVMQAVLKMQKIDIATLLRAAG